MLPNSRREGRNNGYSIAMVSNITKPNILERGPDDHTDASVGLVVFALSDNVLMFFKKCHSHSRCFIGLLNPLRYIDPRGNEKQSWFLWYLNSDCERPYLLEAVGHFPLALYRFRAQVIHCATAITKVHSTWRVTDFVQWRRVQHTRRQVCCKQVSELVTSQGSNCV